MSLTTIIDITANITEEDIVLTINPNVVTINVTQINGASMAAVSSIDFPRLLAPQQIFTIPAGVTAKWAFVNGAVWYPLTSNNASEPNTFTQSGTTFTFKSIRPINNYIVIFYQ